MNREQIEKWAREASEHAGHICGEVDPTPSVRQFWSVRDEHFARLVRAAALEEAKEACLEIMPEHNHLIGPYQCAKAIDALAEKEQR